MEPLRIVREDHEPDPIEHDYPACEDVGAHVDRTHEAVDCGYLTPAQQRAQIHVVVFDCGHSIGYCTNACDGLPPGFDEEDFR